MRPELLLRIDSALINSTPLTPESSPPYCFEYKSMQYYFSFLDIEVPNTVMTVSFVFPVFCLID